MRSSIGGKRARLHIHVRHEQRQVFAQDHRGASLRQLDTARQVHRRSDGGVLLGQRRLRVHARVQARDGCARRRLDVHFFGQSRRGIPPPPISTFLTNLIHLLNSFFLCFIIKVCHIEPLKFERFAQSIVDKLAAGGNATARSASVKRNLENINQIFQKYSLLAMASFTKIFVVTLRPKLTVLFTYPLHGNIRYLPIINWQFVIMQSSLSSSSSTTTSKAEAESLVAQSKRFVTPILACARESAILFFQIDYYSKRLAALCSLLISHVLINCFV